MLSSEEFRREMMSFIMSEQLRSRDYHILLTGYRKTSTHTPPLAFISQKFCLLLSYDSIFYQPVQFLFVLSP
jgi:hypothetical protein